MKNLVLVKPSIEYREAYREMIEDWHSAGEEPHPWVLELNYQKFPALVEKLAGFALGAGVPDGYVPSSTFWAYLEESGKIVGAVNLRHGLNDSLLKLWGQIGYGVAPGYRGNGYATRMLALALEEARKMSLERVLLSCFRDNRASARVILKNGGVLENEVLEPESGKVIQRYWISLQEARV